MFLTDIINGCWKLSYFPRAWKKAVIINILKPGKDVHNPENYRPISLLPIPGKILEKTILKRFQDFAEEHALIPNYQFGFRARHSCNLQLMRKVETILTAWNKNSQVAVCYFDIARAFDSVWHLGLVWKF
ncbi:reverse transcriptase family protein, partial [Salmonella enterica subsp. enterica serovar Infantis]|nr:reverse transcriptase family protein [Salmonella enterica subsp. enterica serovar Infantis]